MFCNSFLEVFLDGPWSLKAGRPTTKSNLLMHNIINLPVFYYKLPDGKRLLPLVIPGLRLEIVVGCTLIAAPSLCLNGTVIEPAVAKNVLNCPSVFTLSNLFLYLSKFSRVDWLNFFTLLVNRVYIF